VVVSFALFAIDQAGNASAHQQNEVNASGPPSSSTPPKTTNNSKTHQSGVRKAIDDASSTITSPFAGAVAEVHNEWAKRGIRMALALLVYGFGLGYLARMLRMRV